MAIVNKEEYLTALRNQIGDSTDDNVLKLLEDFSDTYDDMFSRLNNTDDTDWKSKYEENDKEWREKYRARFFDTQNDIQNDNDNDNNNDTNAESITIDDLFS